MGLFDGQRAMTPLAYRLRRRCNGRSASDNGAPTIIVHPLAALASVLPAAAEMGDDKMKTAPDCIVPVGLAARSVTSALAGAALPRCGSVGSAPRSELLPR